MNLLARAGMLVAALLAAAAVLPAQAAAYNTTTDCTNDPGLSLKVCLYQDYDLYTTNGVTYTKITRYAATLTRLDSRVVFNKLTIKSAVKSNCSSSDWSSCYTVYSSGYVSSYTSPSVGYYYFNYPPWAGRWTRITGGLQYSCAHAIVEYSRGTGRYQYQTPNLCKGSL